MFVIINDFQHVIKREQPLSYSHFLFPIIPFDCSIGVSSPQSLFLAYTSPSPLSVQTCPFVQNLLNCHMLKPLLSFDDQFECCFFHDAFFDCPALLCSLPGFSTGQVSLTLCLPHPVWICCYFHMHFTSPARSRAGKLFL